MEAGTGTGSRLTARPVPEEVTVPDLYELTELASYMQTDLDEATATLNRLLVTAEFRRAVGRTRWDAATVDQLADLKGLALEIAKRMTLNPDGKRSEQIDDYSYTNATETFGGLSLTDAERNAVRAVFGLRSGAFSITPAAPTPYCPPTRWYRPI